MRGATWRSGAGPAIHPCASRHLISGRLPGPAVRDVPRGISEGLGKAEGIRVGEAAAQAVLTRRAGWSTTRSIRPATVSGPTALTDTVAAYFRTNKVTWTLSVPKTKVPAVTQTERTYDQLNALMRDVDDARVYGGLHWRNSMRHGAQVGRRVSADVTRRYFGVDEEDTWR